MTVTVEVGLSILLVTAVLWWMWRLPQHGDVWYGWAPPLALGSAWCGLLAGVVSLFLWGVGTPDGWLPVVLLFLAPGSIAAGLGVLWIYRGLEESLATVNQQKLQARVGIVLGALAVAVGYYYVLTHKRPFTPIGM